MSFELISNDIVFDSKAAAVPYNYRISYKVSLICLIIGKCCGRRGCSAIKLQMINASLSTALGRKKLLALVSQKRINEITVVRFDPTIIRAINYSISDDLIYQQGNGLFRLTEKGKILTRKINDDVTLMMVEKDFIQELSTRLTEELVESIAESWMITNA